MHFDLAPSVHGDRRAEIDRLVSLGATRVDLGRGEGGQVTMADPDGREFCVVTAP
ncbi:VOC family protein [Streptomyces sp. BE308]|uniref:VOC family protein n=1 Tax=Streptomyces sp. BE308 TaxID=3002529 RepID=UPI002E76F1E1|nr:VOC family protein [Streptomyces sp. BE308]